MKSKTSSNILHQSARRRMFLMTEGPHLYYVDPVNMVLKGEVPWSRTVRPESKNFKVFFMHTVSYVYYAPCRTVYVTCRMFS